MRRGCRRLDFFVFVVTGTAVVSSRRSLGRGGGAGLSGAKSFSVLTILSAAGARRRRGGYFAT